LVESKDIYKVRIGVETFCAIFFKNPTVTKNNFALVTCDITIHSVSGELFYHKSGIVWNGIYIYRPDVINLGIQPMSFFLSDKDFPGEFLVTATVEDKNSKQKLILRNFSPPQIGLKKPSPPARLSFDSRRPRGFRRPLFSESFFPTHALSRVQHLFEAFRHGEIHIRDI
jgi:hypothetical protein